MMNVIRRDYWKTFLAAGWLLVCLLATTGLAQKGGGKGGGNGGGGDDGGGDPPPALPVVYDLQLFDFPSDYAGATVASKQMNLLGELVAYYDVDVPHPGEQPFYLNVNADSPAIINLNDVTLDEDYLVPDGWYIYAALSINNWGDIALALASVDVGPELLRGAVLELRPDPLDPTLLPRLHLLPDEPWDPTYARWINDDGVVLGRGDAETSYTYNLGLHGGTPASVRIVPGFFDAYYAEMNNATDAHETQIVWNSGGNVWRYSLGDESAEVLLAGYSMVGLGDSGQICGNQSSKGKNKSIGYRFDGFEIYDLSESSRAWAINADNDVLGWLGNFSQQIHHAGHGVLELNDYVVARSAAEQDIWTTKGAHWFDMSERNILGTDPSVAEFPSVFGLKNNQLFVLLPVPAN